METKLIAMILGVVLVLAITTVYTQSVFAAAGHGRSGCKGAAGTAKGGTGGAGVTDGQTAHGLTTACANPTVDQINLNCHLPS